MQISNKSASQPASRGEAEIFPLSQVGRKLHRPSVECRRPCVGLL